MAVPVLLSEGHEQVNYQASRLATEKADFRPALTPRSIDGAFTEKHMGKKSRRKKLSKEAWSTQFTQRLIQPVDVEVFRACIHVYQSAARLTMPVENPEQRKFSIDGKVYGFKDIPMNRGMLAVGDFLGDQRDAMMPGICSRIMAFGGALQTIRKDARFAQFFKEDTSDGAYMVSEALTDAFATAQFIDRTLEIDIDSVLEIAVVIAAADEASGGSQG
jgi:hypothetical protein